MELVISKANPLLLFDLDVSLEWDARNDAPFQTELTNSFQRASEILYDVTNGQAALGVVQVFQDERIWPRRMWSCWPTTASAIGRHRRHRQAAHHRDRPHDLSATKIISNAYYGGQIRIRAPSGTPTLGENTAELGEEWWRALAHELAHYLLFLPDNYLGFKGARGVLRPINSRQLHITSTYDPTYSEFLTAAGWRGACLDSLAQRTTGRTDWQAIRTFYGMLARNRRRSSRGRSCPEPRPDRRYHLCAGRNTGGAAGARSTCATRLTSGCACRLRRLTYSRRKARPNPTDDMILQLGTPTGGGGTRLKVRGAFPGDQLCLDRKRYGIGLHRL